MITEFTKLSSKGQIVIPISIREKLNLEEGAPLIVNEIDNSIVIKKADIPKIKGWEEVSKPFKRAAGKTNFNKEDLMKIIREIRAIKR
ncbi:AbrB/MazE/SpoVT family DNA-binding domain-containing protein [Candidatus Pacearchaeota archaeon]|nr:AbrB/MazE/SpoVT family DNA-binding domain-containing protein [Candidatus Pacearchaeota archaeon]